MANNDDSSNTTRNLQENQAKMFSKSALKKNFKNYQQNFRNSFRNIMDEQAKMNSKVNDEIDKNEKKRLENRYKLNKQNLIKQLNDYKNQYKQFKTYLGDYDKDASNVFYKNRVKEFKQFTKEGKKTFSELEEDGEGKVSSLKKAFSSIIETINTINISDIKDTVGDLQEDTQSYIENLRSIKQEVNWNKGDIKKYSKDVRNAVKATGYNLSRQEVSENAEAIIKEGGVKNEKDLKKYLNATSKLQVATGISANDVGDMINVDKQASGGAKSIKNLGNFVKSINNTGVLSTASNSSYAQEVNEQSKNIYAALGNKKNYNRAMKGYMVGNAAANSQFLDKPINNVFEQIANASPTELGEISQSLGGTVDVNDVKNRIKKGDVQGAYNELGQDLIKNKNTILNNDDIKSAWGISEEDQGNVRGASMKQWNKDIKTSRNAMKNSKGAMSKAIKNNPQANFFTRLKNRIGNNAIVSKLGDWGDAIGVDTGDVGKAGLLWAQLRQLIEIKKNTSKNGAIGSKFDDFKNTVLGKFKGKIADKVENLPDKGIGGAVKKIFGRKAAKTASESVAESAAGETVGKAATAGSAGLGGAEILGKKAATGAGEEAAASTLENAGTAGAEAIEDTSTLANTAATAGEATEGVTLASDAITPAVGGAGILSGLSAAQAIPVIGGAVGGGLGIFNGIRDLWRAHKSKNAKEKSKNRWRGGTKLGMVGSGAATGALIGSVVPGIGTGIGALAGAGVSGIAATFGGNKLGGWLQSKFTGKKKRKGKKAEKLHSSPWYLKRIQSDVRKIRKKYVGGGKSGSKKSSSSGTGDAGGDHPNPKGSGVERWRKYVVDALKANGLSTSDDMVNKVLRQIQTESGGNPNVVQQVNDINMRQGHPAQGLMQVIPSTFNAYKFKGHDNIKNGYDNLLAAINYAKHRYGNSLKGLGEGHGYAVGTPFLPNDQIALIHQGEMIVPKAQNPVSSSGTIKSDYTTYANTNNNDDVVDVVQWAVGRLERKIDEVTTAVYSGNSRQTTKTVNSFPDSDAVFSF